MSTWGAIPAKGRIWRCGGCCEPLTFVSHRRMRLAADEQANILRRRTDHAAASPGCRCAQPMQCDAIGCLCPRPSSVVRDDGVYCALCNGQVEWMACRPPTSIWRGDPAVMRAVC